MLSAALRRSPSRRPPLLRALVVVAALHAIGGLFASVELQAQQRPSGVSLTLEYQPGRKVALMVLSVAGTAGDSIKAILDRDFDYSDQFQYVPAIASPALGGTVDYGLAGRAGAAGVVQVVRLPSGWLRVLLHDVAAKKVANQGDFPLSLSENTDSWRLGVHAVADQVQAWITGAPGVAATRVAFVRDDRVWVVDSDGANARAVTPRGMSPSWHPNGRLIAYHVFEEDRIRLAVTDVVTGAQRSLTNVRGANDITPAISPDGRSVVFSRSVEQTAGQTDLYVMPFEGGAATRITVARGSINLAPSWSPDARRLVFASDRSGREEIYISDADGTNVSLLTADAFGERNRRADPGFSPDGRLVAYSSEVGGQRQILTINLRDQSVRQVTSDGRNNSPSWAPDGRHVVYSSTRGGNEQLWVVDIETGRIRQLTRGTPARLADWSARLSVAP
jgi:TolB protein